MAREVSTAWTMVLAVGAMRMWVIVEMDRTMTIDMMMIMMLVVVVVVLEPLGGGGGGVGGMESGDGLGEGPGR